MRKINVRLTDEEHAILAERAAEGRRSLQRQIVFELFHPAPAVRAVLADGSQEFRVVDVTAGSMAAPARNVTFTAAGKKPFVKECRNSEYHWKGPCRWCGGGEPA